MKKRLVNKNTICKVTSNATTATDSIIVVKRDDKHVPYNGSKIEIAVSKALTATEEIDKRRIPMTASIVEMIVREEILNELLVKDKNSISVEQIQDLVENTMIRLALPETVRAYILYRNQHKKVREVNRALLDVKKTMEDYIGEEKDWRVKENSTVSLSLGGLILSNSGTLTANYWLNEIYDEEIANAHRSAAMHIHDLSMFSGYCAGWSLKQLLIEGLGGVEGRITSAPANHLSTLCNQMVNFLGILQNEWAGAQAFSSFDTYLAPFVRVDGLNYKQVKQCIQSFVYGVNTPSRWGCVLPETEILTETGFKRYDQLKKGEMIYTIKNGFIELQSLNEIVVKKHHGVLHVYKGHHYNQTVTPEHRLLLCNHENTTHRIIHSEDLFCKIDTILFPAQVKPMVNMSDDDTDMLQMLSTTGILVEDNIDEIQHKCVANGIATYVARENGQTYIRAYDSVVEVNNQTELPYEGTVWCPNVENGTAVFRNKDGDVFFSGNCQAPFTNITLDWVCPPDMINMPAIVGGKEQNFTYGDCKKEMDMINRAFIEIMIEGDANGRGFQYPIPTYSITKDFDWSDTENNRLLFEMAAKYGTPYFSNYINSDMEPSDVRSMCCRLRLDLRELRKKSGGFFGSGESTGSVGVVTLNLPRLAYLAENEKEFYEALDYLMDIAARSLDTKRKVITRMMNEGLYPYTKKYLGGFDNHFSTIGLVGMNEAARNAKWLHTNLTTPEGQQFAKDVLNHMRERLSDYQERYGALFNLEATPAESTSFRLAKHDVEKYPNIITAAEKGETPFYTNSSHLPVGYTDDVFDALDLQDDLQILYTSGTVFHAFLGERLPDWKAAANLVRKIAENYKLPYYTMSPTYSVCPEHGYIPGEHEKCPKCGKVTEVYSRITGYYRPLKNWNDGKVQEFQKRKEYDVSSNLTLEKSSEKNSFTSHVINEASCVNGSCGISATAPTKKETSELTFDVPILVTTSTCPNCKIVETFLDKTGKRYFVVDVTKHPEIAAKYDIKTVPTLIVPSKDGPQVIANMSNIRSWIEN